MKTTLALAVVLLVGLGASAFAQVGSQVKTIEFMGQEVPYTISDGLVLVFGDVIAGRVEEVLGGNVLSASKKGAQRAGVGYVEAGGAWPKVNGVTTIPYENPAPYAPADEAIRTFNQIFAGVAQFVPRNGETDYITFRQGAVCNSSVGHVGGQQFIGFADYCGVSGMLHEFGHAMGLLHENQHPDRDQFMTVLWDNATKDPQARGDVRIDPRGVRVGLYDIDSLLNPQVSLASRNGLPTLQMLPAGIGSSPFRAGTYSEGNLDAIRRLAGAAPKQVTVTSVPPGLNVIVDGATITTPKTFDWAIGSTHNVDVPDGTQKLNGFYFQFGRWNDSTAKSHQITVTAGAGSGRVDPATSPAVTLISAYFASYNENTIAAKQGSGSGTTAFDTTPVKFPGDNSTYFPNGAAVNIVATPDQGSNFYSFDWKLLSDVGAFPPVSPQFNPYPVNAGGRMQYTPKFTTQPITTITTDPPGQIVIIDGQQRFTPVIFAQEFDPTWTPGSTHTLDVPPDPQVRNSYKLRRFVFRTWSDGQPQRHDIQAAKDGNVTITANFETQFGVSLSANGNNNCAGTFAVTPTAADNFYAANSQVTITANPAAGFQVASWGGLTGVTDTNPVQTVTMSEEQVAAVQFNTINSPLTITGVTPAVLTAGSGDTVVTIDGSGFTDQTDALVWLAGSGSFATPAFVNPNRVTLNIAADRIATPGSIIITLRNNGNPSCRARADFTVPVSPK